VFELSVREADRPHERLPAEWEAARKKLIDRAERGGAPRPSDAKPWAAFRRGGHGPLSLYPRLFVTSDTPLSSEGACHEQAGLEIPRRGH
jgi:hypothetical protein